MSNRYSRHYSIPGFKEKHQKLLKNSRVLVVGAGGLGSPILMYLSAAGVGNIGVVDDDFVEYSNLHRQIIHSAKFVGKSKTSSVKNFFKTFYPEVKLDLYQERLTADNAIELFKKFDIIIDGSDNFPTRYLISDACSILNLKTVWGSVLRWSGTISVFDPLEGYTYRSLFPKIPPTELSLACSDGGVIGSVCGTIGSIMATETIKQITGLGDSLVGNLLIVDLFSGNIKKLSMCESRGLIPGLKDLSGKEYERGTKNLNCSLNQKYYISVSDLRPNDLLVDVREMHEYKSGHIENSINIPLGKIAEGGWSSIPENPTGRIVLYCASGARSNHALSLLQGDLKNDREVFSLSIGYNDYLK